MYMNKVVKYRFIFCPNILKGSRKALLDMVTKELKGLGFTQILLWVLNHKSRNFYEKYRFIFGGNIKLIILVGKP